MKIFFYIVFIGILCAQTAPLLSQNFNYLDNDDEFQIETSSAMNNEQEIISNLVILMDYDMYNRNYQAMLRSLDRLARIYSPDSLALLTRKLELFENHHPFLQLCEKQKSGAHNYAAWQPYSSQQFKLYFAEQVKLLQDYERLSHGANSVAAKIYKSSTAYLVNHAYTEAKYLLNWLKRDYADAYYVRRNFVDNRLKSIELDIGADLPVTRFTTLAGREIRAAASENAPTLIAYLDLYSKDYNSELNNTIQVGERVKNIHMIILLNPDAPLQELSNLVADQAVHPAWVSADDALKKKLGLSDYSSNMLVSSENKIIAKDMDFNTLPEEAAFFCSDSSRLARQ